MSRTQIQIWTKMSLVMLGVSLISAFVLNVRAGYLADEYAGIGKEVVSSIQVLADWSIYFFLITLAVTLALVSLQCRSRKRNRR